MSGQMSVRTMAMVAAALSEEYGVQVTCQGTQAYTVIDPWGKDKPVINIPAVDSTDKDYLTMLRGYIDHEVGHVRFSRYQKGAEKKPAALQTMRNIFEDVFVDRTMGECFPGSERNLNDLVQTMFVDKRQPVITEKDVMEAAIKGDSKEAANNIWNSVFQYSLYKARSEKHKNIADLLPEYEKAIDGIAPGLRQELDKVINRIHTEGVDTAANNKLAEEALEVIQQYFQQQADQQGQGQEGGGEEGDQEGEGQGGEGQGEGQADGDGSDQEGQEDQNDQESKGSGKGKAQGKGKKSKQKGDGAGKAQKDKDDGSLAQDVLDSAHDTKADGGSNIGERVSQNIKEEAHSGVTPEDMSYHGYGSRSWDSHLKEIPGDELNEAMQASAALDAQLQSLLQTYKLNRGGAARAGRLDTNKLHRLSVGNGRVFRRKVEKRGIDTEIILCVDMSGSMGWSGKDRVTSQSLYAVMKSLRKIQGVTSSVAGFAGSRIIDILRKGDPVTSRLFIVADGGTQCGEAMYHALQQFSPRKESRKILIMMTDGDTSNQIYFRSTIEAAKASGVEVMGIGIESTSIKQYLEDEECCILSNVGQLAPEMFRMLRHKLLGGA